MLNFISFPNVSINSLNFGFSVFFCLNLLDYCVCLVVACKSNQFSPVHNQFNAVLFSEFRSISISWEKQTKMPKIGKRKLNAKNENKSIRFRPEFCSMLRTSVYLNGEDMHLFRNTH